MNYTGLLKEYINEVAIELSGESYKVISGDGENFLLKSNGGKLWEKSIPGEIKCFSVYKAITTESSIDPVQIIKAIKDPVKKGKLKVPQGTVQQILDKSVGICLPHLKSMNLDVVTTPESSKSLAVKFAKLISENLGVRFVPAGTVKDMTSARLSGDLPTSYGEKSISGLRRSLERMKTSQDKNLHKHFYSRDRKFVADWQKARDVSKFSQGERILLVDDVLSDGSTLAEMKRALSDLDINVVAGITLFRTGS